MYGTVVVNMNQHMEEMEAAASEQAHNEASGIDLSNMDDSVEENVLRSLVVSQEADQSATSITPPVVNIATSHFATIEEDDLHGNGNIFCGF